MASQELLYVLPSHPQTGKNSVGQIAFKSMREGSMHCAEPKKELKVNRSAKKCFMFSRYKMGTKSCLNEKIKALSGF